MAARLFALWLVVISFQSLGIASFLGGRPDSGAAAPLLYVMPLLPLLLAAFLWFFPMFIAHKLVPRTHDANALKIPGRELLAAGTAILGLWASLRALPQLFAVLGLLIAADRPALGFYFTPDRRLDLLSCLLEAAFGIFLVARPWWVARRILPEGAPRTDAQ
ncbi:hypothetical protein AWB61_00035 [Chromobacterium sp. F49]|nr:hypothetical protein Cv017_18875 [Chromobacterium subtsugae]KZE88311.1 hypothetical protein AWB61_00035 [Chromobacterium sp. F49]